MFDSLLQRNQGLVKVRSLHLSQILQEQVSLFAHLACLSRSFDSVGQFRRNLLILLNARCNLTGFLVAQSGGLRG